VVVLALPSLSLLLVAVGLRHRSGHVVVPLLATSLALGGLLLAPLVAALPAAFSGDRPEPPYDEAGARPVVVYTQDLAAPRSAPVLRSHRTDFDAALAEQDRVDAAVNELIGSRAPAGRRSYWSLPCTRTYTGMVRVEVDAVEIKLLGPPRRTTPGCRLSARELRLQEQQLAWTVRANLDDPATPITVREPGSTSWTVLQPDPAYVEHP
jgi:hypothetical protein